MYKNRLICRPIRFKIHSVWNVDIFTSEWKVSRACVLHTGSSFWRPSAIYLLLCCPVTFAEPQHDDISWSIPFLQIYQPLVRRQFGRKWFQRTEELLVVSLATKFFKLFFFFFLKGQKQNGSYWRIIFLPRISDLLEAYSIFFFFFLEVASEGVWGRLVTDPKGRWQRWRGSSHSCSRIVMTGRRGWWTRRHFLASLTDLCNDEVRISATH